MRDRKLTSACCGDTINLPTPMGPQFAFSLASICHWGYCADVVCHGDALVGQPQPADVSPSDIRGDVSMRHQEQVNGMT